MLGKGARNSGKRSGGAKSQKTISEFFVSFQDNFDIGSVQRSVSVIRDATMC